MGKAIAVLGHYGSGKTEFSVNYAMHLKRSGVKTALLDLDIANPYFRSKQGAAEDAGGHGHFNLMNMDSILRKTFRLSLRRSELHLKMKRALQ